MQTYHQDNLLLDLGGERDEAEVAGEVELGKRGKFIRTICCAEE